MISEITLLIIRAVRIGNNGDFVSYFSIDFYVCRDNSVITNLDILNCKH